MSRLFDDASTEYGENAAAVLTAMPLTMACWFYSNDLTIAQNLISISSNGVTNRSWALCVDGTLLDVVTARANNAGGAQAASSTGATVNTWHHGCAVFTSTTNRDAYIDGGSGGNDTATATTASTANTTSIGRLVTSAGGSRYMSGRIAEPAIWNVALSTGEIAALGAGVSPLRIRPNALVFYVPLYGVASPEPDYRGGFDLTLTGTVVGDHARVSPPWGRASGWRGTITGVVATLPVGKSTGFMD